MKYLVDIRGFTGQNFAEWDVSMDADLAPRKMLLLDEVRESLPMDAFVQEMYDRSVREVTILPGEDEIETNRRQIGYLNIRYFMQTLLNRMDRTSMHSGLEARVPFADRTLVDYIFNVPWEMKAKDGLVKNVLRQASRGLLRMKYCFDAKAHILRVMIRIMKHYWEQDCSRKLKTRKRRSCRSWIEKSTKVYRQHQRLWKTLVWTVDGRSTDVSIFVAD